MEIVFVGFYGYFCKNMFLLTIIYKNKLNRGEYVPFGL